jgi:3-oxoadipate enol-lactonase
MGGMGRIETKAGALAYRLDGAADAPVIVLSASLGTTHALWDAQVEALARDWRILRYDMRGHGASSIPPGPWTVADLGQDVLALLDALGLARVAFCGLSLGGMIGMWLALAAPARIARLVLANTTARTAAPAAWDARIAAVEAGGMAAVAEPVLERWLTPLFRAREPAAAQRVRAMLLACPPVGYARACAAVRDMDLLERLDGIGVPTLVIAGAHDPATPPADARAIATRLARAELVELEAAHLSNIEQAGEEAAQHAVERAGRE